MISGEKFMFCFNYNQKNAQRAHLKITTGESGWASKVVLIRAERIFLFCFELSCFFRAIGVWRSNVISHTTIGVSGASVLRSVSARASES